MEKRPEAAIIIAGVRTGGHYLTCALSNHPQIFCVREEPLHRNSAWRKVPLEVIFSQHYYDVALCKFTPGQLEVSKFKRLFRELNPKIILLERENLIEQAVSDLINNLRLKGHPTHTFHKVVPPKITLNPNEVVRRYRGIATRRKAARKFVESQQDRALYLTYERLFSEPSEVSAQICDFLGVDRMLLTSRMKKVHSIPYSEFVLNWSELVNRVEGD